MSKKAVQAAGGIVRDADGRFAVVHRPHRADWSLPKGHLEGDETHAEAAVREVFEETGLRCRIVGDAGAVGYIDPNGRPKEVRYFHMDVVDGSFTVNDEVDELRWIGSADVDLLTYPLDRSVVEAAAAQRDE